MNHLKFFHLIIHLIKKSAFYAAHKAVDKQSGLSGLDMDMENKLNLISINENNSAILYMYFMNNKVKLGWKQ